MLKKIFKFIFLICCLLNFHFCVQAQERVPNFVKQVKNHEQLVEELVDGMCKHKVNMSFYYDGIIRNFKRYSRKQGGYQTFYDQLAKRNGYITGILSGSCITVKEKEGYVTFQFCYLTSKKQERYINKTAKRIAKRIRKGSRVTQIKKAHDYLVNHIRYDGRYYNPYYAFKKGKGMCMSYALAFQRIMQELKIPCIYVKGSNHAWNMVKIRKCWYNIDVTWDDNNGGYRYFLKCDKDFPRHRRPKTPLYRSLKMAKKSY